MLIWTPRNIPNVGLFSAYAEVFPRAERDPKRSRAFLCLRRGVSKQQHTEAYCRRFSLPTQRCFPHPPWQMQGSSLFSAYAEVFPRRGICLRPLPTFLCLRRGVSYTQVDSAGSFTFSLPTQRCFHSGFHARNVQWLFSAYAEVFLGLLLRGRTPGTFLCLRRGVSITLTLLYSIPALFSAYAEVFPSFQLCK